MPSILPMYDAGSSWIKDRIGVVLGVVSDITLKRSPPGQLLAKVKGMTTEVNVLEQTYLKLY